MRIKNRRTSEFSRREREYARKECLLELDRVAKKIKAYTQIRLDLMKQTAEQFCPIKVDDITPIIGYSWTMKVTRVDMIMLCRGYAWKICGIVLKTDGSESVRTTSFEVPLE